MSLPSESFCVILFGRMNAVHLWRLQLIGQVSRKAIKKSMGKTNPYMHCLNINVYTF